MITGGSGSLGQALVRSGLQQEYTIRVYSRNEYNQWRMKQEVKSDRVRWMLGDVRDRDRLVQCMKGVDYVIHCAALKHVSFGQYNPQEFVKTNIMGSLNVVDIAVQMGVKKVLGISSDKSVNPSCLYGITKQAMEQVFLDANRWAVPDTKFSVFRSGNFLESHGNVFELWERQAPTGEICLTDPDMARWIIPVDQAANVVWDCLDAMEGREVFIPKMTEYRMEDILEAGRKRYPDCRVRITGAQDGEKLRESLFADGEQKRALERDRYYVIQPKEEA